MKLNRLLIILSLIAVASCAQKQQNIISDLIEPINLKEETTTSLVLNDLFYAEKYNVDFLPSRNFDVILDTSENTIEITPLNNFSGLDLISFNYYGSTYELPVKLAQKKKYSFKYNPSGNPKKVNLFGQFNGWNRKNLPMNDDDGDGVYEIIIPLDPGRYEYKFFVDGEELIDPENPAYVPNGLGDFNSIRIIEKTVADNHYLHLLNYKEEEKTFSYKFYYESITRDLITQRDVIALIDNFKISPEKIKLDGNNITFNFPRFELNGNKVIRVAISKNGKYTNFQTVRLENGTPIGNESNKSWYDAIIYSLMVDRYYDGDSTNSIPIEHPDLSFKANYQGGDLQGLIDKLEEGYFDSLGINTFWISPIIDNTDNAFKEYPPPHRFYTGYHGYWPVSPNKVEEHFGDMNLAKKFVETAHKHGIKVLIDYIANHVHIEHPFWKEHRNWFGVLDLPNGKKNLRLWDEQRLTTWFEPYLPSFDYVGSKEALEVMTDNAIWWLKETGADGFRHDAVKHVPNEFWRTLTRKLKEEIEIPTGKKVYQIGETFGSFDLISSYVNNGQLSSQFNFNLYDVALPVFLYDNNSFELLDLQMQKTFSVYGVNHLMGNLVDSHDKIRYMAYADGDIELNSNLAQEIGWTNPPKVDHKSSYKKLQLHLAYILTIPGVPVIYYGDEIGMTGAADPDNRRMMRFDDLNNNEIETKTEVSNLIKIRNEHPALRYGDFVTLLADENCYAYIRSDMNERVLVILNKNGEPQTVELNIPAVYDVENCVNIPNGNTIKVNNGKLSVKIPAIGWSMFVLQ
jgi:cyclomaltodextrinase / maltogenic alpha-amylase / neopullulanase